MILPVLDLLPPDVVRRLRATLSTARFQDGAATAGWHAKLVKANEQVAPEEPALAEMRHTVERAVREHPVAGLATRPKAFGPILFSRYGAGHCYGSHVDDALLGGMRTDVSFTLFLADPDAYAGGELVMETHAGDLTFKLPAGGALFYPSTTLHRVAPVTAGERLAAVGWLRSYVRDPADRELLFDLDTARQTLFRQSGKTPEFDLLSKCLSNLLRRWVED